MNEMFGPWSPTTKRRKRRAPARLQSGTVPDPPSDGCCGEQFCLQILSHLQQNTPRRMKIAFIATDNREAGRTYSETAPHFSTGSDSLVKGFAAMPDVELHVISCMQRAMPSPEKLADNIWFHTLHVPKIGWLRTSIRAASARRGTSFEKSSRTLCKEMERNGSAPSAPCFPGFPTWWPCKGTWRNWRA